MFGAVSFFCAFSAYGDEPLPLLLNENDFISLIAVDNDQVRHQRMEVQANEQLITNAWSAFEPILEISAVKEYGEEENDTEASAQRSSTSVYQYEDRTLALSISGILPTGTEYKAYIEQEDPSNSLQVGTNFGHEYKTTIGLEITQPLLKNFGWDVNLSNVNIAEKEHQISTERLLQCQ